MVARVATVRMGPGGGDPGQPRSRLQEHPCSGLPFMPFSFVHTADIHLDSPLRSLVRNSDLAEKMSTSARRNRVESSPGSGWPML